MKRITSVAFTSIVFLLGVLGQPQAALLGQTPAAPQTTAKAPATGQPKHITTPKEALGFNLGDDYCLANYQQLIKYWTILGKESDRLKVVEIGKTEEGRPHLMGIVTSPANHAKLAYYQNIAKRMARAEGVSPEEADKLAKEGKAVVWIDGGLHASEVLCAQQLMETLYQFLVAKDPESLRILDDVIILFVNANPDGMDLCADTYMKSSKDPKQRRSGGLGRLYQKYIGHDDNRDFYGNTQLETKNENRVMYREWFPHIVYNHHQTGPQGSVLFCPPFRDPFNYNVDPLVISGVDAVGSAMEQRFLEENKPGATCRSGSSYSTWWNGGLRTTCYFHNMIGLLTESIGNPTPTSIPLIVNKQLPKADYLAPIQPQVWHFRQSVDYSVTANKAVLDYASRNRERLLHNIWLMGKKAIDRGNSDSWTITPKVVAAAEKNRGAALKGAGAAKEFEKLFHSPAKRDPRGFIIPANQADFPTATKFVNALLGTGVTVHRATADFEVRGKKYPKYSYVVKAAQAFRAHAMDMFEPQDHPNDIPYPGAAPIPPYDAAGWTLAFQMGVKFDRILEGFDGPFEEIKELVTAPPPAQVTFAEGAVGFFLSTKMNDSFRAVNQLLKAGEEVRRLQEPFAFKGVTLAAGTFFVPRKATTLPQLQKIAASLGTAFVGSPVAPGKEAAVLKEPRIGLWDSDGGSMPSGWTRWLLERMDYPFKVVYYDDLDTSKLHEKFDVLIFVDSGGGGGKGGGGGGGFNAAPVAQLKKFLEAGGTVLTVGGSTNLGKALNLPIASQVSGLARAKYYIPPSVLEVRVNPANSLAWGMEDHVDVMFSNSPTFKLSPDAQQKGLEKVAWFDTKTPLRSGWALGQENLNGGVAMIDAKVGKGRLAMFGPLILFRAQPHGTFKLLFNGIVQSGISSNGTGTKP